MSYKDLPKIELHLHLDCSLSYKVVSKLQPEISREEYEKSFIAPPKCHDLADYLTRAINGINLMQTKEELELVTLDLFEQLQADHVIYAEMRFAPLEHMQKGLEVEEVITTVAETMKVGIQNTGVEAGLILCTLRHYSEAQSMKVAQLVDQFKGDTVVGFDIAADEAGFPIDNHIEAFKYAKAKNIPCTAHAGEARGADSVWETLEHLKPSRIGHGVRSVEDPELLDYLKANNIHLEVCPTSNVQTDVVATIEDHQADQLYRRGISMSVNTDARTISNVSLLHEYEVLEQLFSWQKEHFKKCSLEAIKHAFTTSAKKAKLKAIIEKAYN